LTGHNISAKSDETNNNFKRTLYYL
jgi:subtilase family serine protease